MGKPALNDTEEALPSFDKSKPRQRNYMHQGALLECKTPFSPQVADATVNHQQSIGGEWFRFNDGQIKSVGDKLRTLAVNSLEEDWTSLSKTSRMLAKGLGTASDMERT